MDDELLTYFRAIRLRGSVRRREWYWPKNAHRPPWLAYTLEYEPLTLVLKVLQFLRRRRALAPLTRSQRPSVARIRADQVRLHRDPQRQGSFEVELPTTGVSGAGSVEAAGNAAISASGPLSLGGRISVRLILSERAFASTVNHPHPDPLPEGNKTGAEGSRSRSNASTPIDGSLRFPAAKRRLLLAHVYFEAEAAIIFEKLRAFPEYVQIVTTSVPSLRDAFLEQADPRHTACLLVPNVGRDVLPFLLAIAALDLSGYDQFVKVHTKRSVHLNHGADWFGMNLDALLGSRHMTDRLLNHIDPHTPNLYGLQTLPLRDHVVQNRHWLRYLTGGRAALLRGHFVPGTMFAGSGEFLRELASLKLHLHRPELEAGQLDGTLVHALERFFGYLAQSRGGECRTLEALVSDHHTRKPDQGSDVARTH